MSKSELQKEVRLEIRLPQSGYPKTMFFNRVQVEREDGFCLVHFGLVSKSGLLLDSYSCVLPQEALVQNQKSLLEYLGRIGQPKQKNPQSWPGGKAGSKTDIADIINMSFRDDTAETCLFVYSMTAAARQGRSSATDTVEAQPLVLLRSLVEMQKQLIEALYAEEHICRTFVARGCRLNYRRRTPSPGEPFRNC